MAPNRGTTVKGKSNASKGILRSSRESKERVAKSNVRRPPKQQKTKAASTAPKKKKQRTYTDEELGLPKLNMITPAGVQKSRGKKKGKVFVDDAESMMTILAMVNAEKEGQIESKMVKARQMEHIREARKAEQEKKEAERKDKLNKIKDGLRRKRNKNSENARIDLAEETADRTKRDGKPKKKVSFG